MASANGTASLGQRRAFAREWHRELRQAIGTAQDRREEILRWSLPIAFATLASSATSADALVASSALWRWLVAGVVLVVAVETTYRLTRDIIYAAARNERLETLDPSLPPFERSVQEPAGERHARSRLPVAFKRYWPRRGRSRMLALWYAAAAAGAIAYWLFGISHASVGQSLAALVLPGAALLACARLVLIGRWHWQREELLANDRLLRWVEDAEGEGSGDDLPPSVP